MRPLLKAPLAAACCLLAPTTGLAQAVLLERGIAAYEAERYEQAIAVLTQALDQLTTDEAIARAHSFRGKARAALGDCKAAIEDWMVSLALEPPSDVYSNIGYCHFQLEQYVEATLYLGFDALNYPNSATYILLGKAEALSDNFDAADESFRAALALEPESAEARRGLTLVQRMRELAVAEASAAEPANTAFTILNVQLGVDTVETIERDIRARGGNPSAGAGPRQYRLSALSGDYSDGGQSVMAVNYDFDGMGPTGRLIGLTIVSRANSIAEFDELLAERTAAVTREVGPLAQQSSTEFLATAPNCKLRFLPNADTLFIYELYELPN